MLSLVYCIVEVGKGLTGRYYILYVAKSLPQPGNVPHDSPDCRLLVTKTN
jgi:hypothetical protein